MDSIPSEILVKIVSSLDLLDQINCRLVCQSFKDTVDLNLKSITTICSHKPCIEDEEYWFYDLYCSEVSSHHRPHLIYYSSDTLSPGLVKFLSLKCPQLQNLFASKLFGIVYLEDFVPLSKSLKSIFCRNLSWLGGIDKICRSFDKLEAIQTLNIITKQLLNGIVMRTGPLKHLCNPSDDFLIQLNEDDLTSPVQSIEFYNDFWEQILPLNVASNLRSLLINNSYPKVISSLPNLEYLSISTSYYELDLVKFASSKKLKKITLRYKEMKNDPLFMKTILKNLDSFHQLKYFELYIDVVGKIPNNSITEYQLSLPSNLEILYFDVAKTEFKYTVELVTGLSKSLRSFRCGNLLTLQWNFPRLEYLKISISEYLEEFNEHDVQKLASSLTKSTRLSDLQVRFPKTGSNLVLKAIGDSLYALRRLKNFKLSSL